MLNYLTYDPFISTQQWDVSAAYKVESGFLIEADRHPSRAYNPFGEVELPTALARVSTGDISPERFASEFGLLGYGRLLEPGPKSRAEYLAFRKTQEAGDPLDWVIAHSRTVALCIDLVGGLESHDDVLLSEQVETAKAGPYAWGLNIGNLPLSSAHRLLYGPFTDGFRKTAPSVIARSWLHPFITENIAGVRRRMSMDAYGTRLYSFFSFRAMIQAVYWQLADRVEGGHVRRCAECKRFFLARDKRQQYCPPLPGSSRSRCSSRLNVKNFKLRREQ